MALAGQVRSVVDANSSAVDLVTSEIRRAVLTGALPAGEQFLSAPWRHSSASVTSRSERRFTDSSPRA